MTSNRPYLVRAIYDWILDNDLTPHLVIDAGADEVVVPRQYVEDGKIVLNVSPGSVRGLELGNQRITFGARFAGTHFNVSVPTGAILGIYARENGRGLAFGPEEEPPPGDPPPGEPSGEAGPPRGKKGPSLRVVK